ncbi:MAG: hypothetical protein AB2672_10190 [Candidatus Thiodiazotropha endolucinida]
MTNTRNGSIANILLLISLTGLAIFILYQLLQSFGVLDVVADSDRLSNWIAELGYFGPITLIGLMAVAIIVNPIPAPPSLWRPAQLMGTPGVRSTW